MKKCTLFLILLAFLGLAGCKNPFLMEMFSPKGPPLEDIILTDSRGHQIPSDFDPEILYHTYTIDTNVRLKLVLGRGATVRWGFTNVNNGYNGEIIVSPTLGETKQVLLSVTGKRGPAKMYVLSFFKTSAYYLRADAPPNGDGTYERPFNKFSVALMQAANSPTKTIFVDGEITAAAGDGSTGSIESTFAINDSGVVPISFVGLADAALTGTAGKYALSVSGVSNVIFESILIDGGLHIDTDAGVTLGSDASVRESGSGVKGVYVAGGSLTIAGIGTPGRVFSSNGVTAGEIYLVADKEIQLEGNFSAPPNTVLAKISSATPLLLTAPRVQVLTGDVQNNYAYFKAANEDYKIASSGELAIANMPTGDWYVSATNSADTNSGIDAAHPFKTLGRALTAVAQYAIDVEYTGTQIINVAGTLNQTTESGPNSCGNAANTFVINNIKAKELIIKGGILSSTSGSGKRVVLVETNSKPIRFESIIIRNASVSTQSSGGGSMYIHSGATVTLGNGADVQGLDASSGNGKGVHVEGALVITGTTPGKVSGGDVFLPEGTKIKLEGSFVAPQNTVFAKISSDAPLSINTPSIQVLVGDVQDNHEYFKAASDTCKITSSGELKLATLPTGDWYVSSSIGNDSNTGIDAAHPFKTLGKTLASVTQYATDINYTGVQTINVSGTLNETTESGAGSCGDDANAFIINNTKADELIIKGGNLTSATTGGKRVVSVTANSKPIRFESITIKNGSMSGQMSGGGSIYINLGATVTLGNSADVQGMDTSNGNGKGVYVGGTLVIAGTTPGKVSGGDVYLPSGKKIAVAANVQAQSYTIAKISTEVLPTSVGVRVLDGLTADIERVYSKFQSKNTDYTVANTGDLILLAVQSNVWYVNASTGNDSSNSGITSDKPFKTLGKAIQAVKTCAAAGYITTQTIYVSGTLNYASENATAGDKEAESVFFIYGLGDTLLTIAGTNTATLTNGSTDSTIKLRRILKVVNSTVILKNIKISCSSTTTKNGGGIYIDTTADVTLGDGAEVNSASTSDYSKGVYAGGALAFSGSGKVSAGDVYLLENQTVRIASALTSSSVASFKMQTYPTTENPVRVLSGSSSLITNNYSRFSANDAAYGISQNGDMSRKMYFVKSGGDDSRDGLTANTALKTLAKAVEKASAAGSSIKTICVISVLTSDNSGNTNTDSLFVINNGTVAITIAGIYSPTLNAAGTGKRVVEIAGTGTVTFELISFTGASTSRNGGGLYVPSGKTVVLGSNVSISNNVVNAATANGGGIYSAGTLTIAGSSVRVSSNTAQANKSSASAQAGSNHAYGGGIYIAGGTFKITGTDTYIGMNNATGGSHTNTGGTNAVGGKGHGGGVYVSNGTLEISGTNTTITGNSVSGGTASAPSSIIDLQANGDCYGAGMYVQSGGKVTISGTGTQFLGNIASGGFFGGTAYGGALYHTGTATNFSVQQPITVQSNSASQFMSSGGAGGGLYGNFDPAASNTSRYLYNDNVSGDGARYWISSGNKG